MALKTLLSSFTIAGNRYIVRNNTHQSSPRPAEGRGPSLGPPIGLSKGPLTLNDLA